MPVLPAVRTPVPYARVVSEHVGEWGSAMTAVPVVIGVRSPNPVIAAGTAPASQGLVDTHGGGDGKIPPTVEAQGPQFTQGPHTHNGEEAQAFVRV